MCAQAFPVETPQQHMRLDCCRALCRCYYELRNWVPLESPSRLEAAARQHLLLYKQLHDMAGPDALAWRLYPKHHMMVHVCDTQTNPADLWNYGDEDEIGQAVRLGRRCHEASLNRALLGRYRVQFERA